MSPQDIQDDPLKGRKRPGAERSLGTMKKHTVAAEETLSHLSLKYYGSAAREYWILIYEANKAAIGENPNRIRQGMELVIPELPAQMKKD